MESACRTGLTGADFPFVAKETALDPCLGRLGRHVPLWPHLADRNGKRLRRAAPCSRSVMKNRRLGLARLVGTDGRPNRRSVRPEGRTEGRDDGVVCTPECTGLAPPWKIPLDRNPRLASIPLRFRHVAPGIIRSPPGRRHGKSLPKSPSRSVGLPEPAVRYRQADPGGDNDQASAIGR